MPIPELLIATNNRGKAGEIANFLGDLPVKVVTLRDVGITRDVEEDGETYLENSQKKAREYANESGLPAISDDGGIEIDALGGEPGIRSRRWLGHHATDQELVDHLSKVAKELPDGNRGARFITIVSFAMPHGDIFSAEGSVRGEISREPERSLLEGYPYRSFFYLPELGKFYHESDLTPEETRQYNHRYQAVQALVPDIKRELEL